MIKNKDQKVILRNILDFSSKTGIIPNSDAIVFLMTSPAILENIDKD